MSHSAVSSWKNIWNTIVVEHFIDLQKLQDIGLHDYTSMALCLVSLQNKTKSKQITKKIGKK